MKTLFTLLIAFVSIQSFAQHFDWVSFTPLTTGNANGGSGNLSVTNDSEGNIYTVSVFTAPIEVGADTLYHEGNPLRPDILITKWNPEGEVLNYRHIANLSLNGNPDPQKLLFDEVNGEILLALSSYYFGTEITLLGNSTESDVMLSLSQGAVLRFTTDLDFVSKEDLPGNTSDRTSATVKDGFIYAAQGYNSTISKTDSDGNVLWSLLATGAVYNIADITISDDNYIYVIGHYSADPLSPLTLGEITVTPPSAGSYSHSIIFKLDADGTVLQGNYFAQLSYYTNPVCLTTDEAGNVYVGAGYSVAGQMIGDHALSTPTGIGDTFIAKLNSTLQAQWVTEFHHAGGHMEVREVIINPSGKIMVVGAYEYNSTIGSFPLAYAQYGSCFLAQLDDADGNILYATNFGSLNAGSGRPYGSTRIGSKYYIAGLSYGSNINNPNLTASYGCYTQTRACAFLTCFNDVPFESPTVELVYGSVSLIASSNAEDATFQWFLNDEEIEGETGSSIVPSVAGNYEVVVSSYGCTASDTYTLECLPTTGTDIITACNGYTWIDGITYTSNNSSATHLLTSSLGCDSLVTLNLTVEQISDIVTVSGNTLSAAQNNAEYIWLDCDAKLTAIPNETAQTFTPTQNGRYAVQVITGECSVITECVEITTVSLSDYETHSSINIYPNPAKEAVTISNASIGAAIRIFDFSGKLVYSTKINSTQTVINTVGFSTGVYLLQVENHGHFERMKFLVNNQ